MPHIQQPFGLAAHSMTTLAGTGEDKSATPLPEVPKVPDSMMALPARKQ